MSDWPGVQASLGERFAGRFRIDGWIGRGGMAEVFSATDLAGGAPVAVKVLRPSAAAGGDGVERFRREGALVKELGHPAVVAVETFGVTEDGRWFIVMERLGGETLHTYLRRHGALDADQVTPWLTALVSVLEAAHARGVVHRDLKPGNLMIVPGEAGPTLKVLDFGVSKLAQASRLTDTGEILGTPRYMSPEQLCGDPRVDARADVYAVGAILYECLAGAPAFGGGTPDELVAQVLHGAHRPLVELRPDLGAAILAVVERALAVDPGNRPQSATELLRAWRAAVEVEPTMIDVGASARTKAMGSIPPDHDVPSARTDSFRAGTFAPRPIVPRAAAGALPDDGEAAVARPSDVSVAGLPSRRRRSVGIPPWAWALAAFVGLGAAAAVASLLARFGDGP